MVSFYAAGFSTVVFVGLVYLMIYFCSDENDKYLPKMNNLDVGIIFIMFSIIWLVVRGIF